MNRMHFSAVGFVFACWLAAIASAAIALPAMFGDHMVLQRGMDVPVWGTASPGEKVIVEAAGKSATATADDKGDWSCKLPPLKVGDTTELTIKADNETPIVFKDVLIGDVWICSGQSNMGFQVKSGNDAEKEIAEANYPSIRFFTVPTVTSTQPTKKLNGKWELCSPKTVADFSAVGYFFGRDIHKLENVPVGLIANAWGGMPAESFTSAEMLATDPAFKPLFDRKNALQTPEAQAARKKWEADNQTWSDKWQHKDPGNEGFKNGWAKVDLDESDWKPMELPKHWEDDGLKIDGAVWFRRTIDVPKEWQGKTLALSLGGIDDYDTTYVNGEQVGKTEGIWAIFIARQYDVKPEMTTSGKITVAVRVFDIGGTGGFYGPAVSMNLSVKGDDSVKPISLAGAWKYKVEKGYPEPANIPPRPAEVPSPDAPSLASNIYNSMVYPLIPYGIKGAIWYQGESNADRAKQYRKLFPAMIQDWRNRWGEGNFPFLFVQLANFGNWKPRPEQPADSAWAELREAQTMTLKKSPNTGMAVIIDIGDSADIHPKDKQDVGKRLALLAEKKVYGKTNVEDSGPMYESQAIDGDSIKLKFTHAAGLIARGDVVKGFAVVGDDHKFHWADAKIEGDVIVVSSKDVPKPLAVRYGWGDDPKVNVFNGAGLPMCPFRTDDWNHSTAAAK